MVLVHLAKGFEEIEALTVVDILRRAGEDCKSVSMGEGLSVEGAHGITVTCDMMFEAADYDECQMMVLPGGMPGSANLLKHAGLRSRILSFYEEGKHLAAICAAPMIFGDLGILKGAKATIYKGMEEYLKGAEVSEDRVVVSGNIITSRGPSTAMDFALKLAEIVRGEQVAENLRKDLLLK